VGRLAGEGEAEGESEDMIDLKQLDQGCIVGVVEELRLEAQAGGPIKITVSEYGEVRL
jgi:hypothetical protein